jgi:hypothetical protein
MITGTTIYGNSSCDACPTRQLQVLWSLYAYVGKSVEIMGTYDSGDLLYFMFF